MSSFKRLNVNKYKNVTEKTTPDSIYWKQLGVPTLVKEFGAIDYVDFSPLEPHYFAVTCSVRVQIYNPITKLVVKNLSRFQETAYGATFRSDGRLLVAGDEQGNVKIFDTSSKNILRLFKGHTSAVHRATFIPHAAQVVSFSDDQTVKLWDIATEKMLQTYNSHTDYIRAGTVNPVSPNIVVSGGYDGVINMYDTRTQKAIYTVKHDSPVESLLFLPSGGIFASAGGTEMRVWNAFAGCRLLTKVSQHHKTITCLRLGSNGRRILSSSLDRHVKIFDVESYKTVHTLDFPNAVLSMAVAPNNQALVAGMVDGLISIQNFESHEKKNEKSSARPTRRDRHFQVMSKTADHVVDENAPARDTYYNTYLRKYQYAKCLECILKPYITNKTPEITVSVLQELIQRKGLHRALAGRNDPLLMRLMGFIRRYIGEHRFTRRLIDVTMILLDVYDDSFHEISGDLGKQLILLANAVQKETELTYELLELQGGLEIIVDVTTLASDTDESIQFVKSRATTAALVPSAIAKENSIVSVA